MKKNKGTQVIDVPTESESPDTPKDGALQLYQPSSLPDNRPIASTNLEISEIFAMAGKRPIESSHLVIRESVYESGIRPIAASGTEIFSIISMSGKRPIAALDLHITGTFSRNRPIASNNIDDVENLMGFLD